MTLQGMFLVASHLDETQLKSLVWQAWGDWLQSLKQFFIKESYHVLVASLTLMGLFYNRAIRVRLATSIWYDTLMKICFKDWSRLGWRKKWTCWPFVFLSLKILICMLNHPGINQQAPSIESKSTQYFNRQTDRKTDRQTDRFKTYIKLCLFLYSVSDLKELWPLFLSSFWSQRE